MNLLFNYIALPIKRIMPIMVSVLLFLCLCCSARADLTALQSDFTALVSEWRGYQRASGSQSSLHNYIELSYYSIGGFGYWCAKCDSLSGGTSGSHISEERGFWNAGGNGNQFYFQYLTGEILKMDGGTGLVTLYQDYWNTFSGDLPLSYSFAIGASAQTTFHIATTSLTLPISGVNVTGILPEGLSVSMTQPGVFVLSGTPILNSDGDYPVTFSAKMGQFPTSCGNYLESPSYSTVIHVEDKGPAYQIVTKATPSNGGATSGAGSYVAGTSVTVSAVANSGYVFNGWSDPATGSPISSGSAFTFTVSGNRNFQANFTQGVSVSVQASPATGGTVSGGGGFAVGASTSISATANTGWTFTGWSDGNTQNPRTITVPAGGAAFTANFQQQTTQRYLLNLACSPTAGGAIVASPLPGADGKYAAGTTITLTGSSAAGYRFDAWSGGSSGLTNPVQITINADTSITAQFVSGSYRSLRSFSSNGYAPGQPVTVTIAVTPDSTTKTYGVQDAPPAGWSVSNINNYGEFDSVNNQVKWVFLDNGPRTLSYQATPPADATGTQIFVGTYDYDGIDEGIGGDSSIALASYHPADKNGDFKLELSEAVSYGSAYKTTGGHWTSGPDPIPLNYAVKAGTIYKYPGGAYKYDGSLTPPQCWISGSAAVRALSAMRTAKSAALVQTNVAIRKVPSGYKAGQPLTVSISVTPGSSTLTYGLEENPPAGWTVIPAGIDNEGVWDSINHRVKWVFLDNKSRTVAYQVIPPAGTSGTARFGGIVDFDGADFNITGQTTLASTTNGGDAELVVLHGDDNTGIDGTAFDIFGAPAGNDAGGMAWQAHVYGTAESGEGIWVESGTNRILTAFSGDAVPGVTGGLFTSFSDPVLNSKSHTAFRAQLVTGLGGVTTANASGIWATTSGRLSLIARAGSQAPGCPSGSRFSAFTKLVATDYDQVLFTANLVQGSGGVTIANDQGLWIVDKLGARKLLIREGGKLIVGTLTKTVTSFSTFVSPSYVGAQSRGFNRVGTATGLVSFSDGTSGIFKVSATGAVSMAAAKNGAAPGITGAKFSSFGTPAINDAGRSAFRATVAGTGITSANNTGIWADSSLAVRQLIARTGGAAAGVSMAVFAGLSDPAYNNNGRVAFIGTLKVGVAGVTIANASGVWSNSSGVLKLMARAQGQAPDCPIGAKFASFSKLVLPDQGGAVILANLLTGAGGVTSANSQGLWAVDTAGQLHLVVRAGDLMAVGSGSKSICGISIFDGASETLAQSRSFNRPGDLIYRVFFTDGTTGICRVVFP